MLGEECEGELCEGGVKERDEEERESEIEVLAGQSVGGRQKKKRKKLKTLTDKEKQSLMMREQVCHVCSTYMYHTNANIYLATFSVFMYSVYMTMCHYPSGQCFSQ